MQGFGGHGVKFGAHLFNELALSIKPFALTERIEDPEIRNGIGAGRSRLLNCCSGGFLTGLQDEPDNQNVLASCQSCLSRQKNRSV